MQRSRYEPLALLVLAVVLIFVTLFELAAFSATDSNWFSVADLLDFSRVHHEWVFALVVVADILIGGIGVGRLREETREEVRR